MKTIKDGDVQMHSKRFFLSKSILSIIAIVFVALTVLFIGSFILFMTELAEAWELTEHGSRGILHFITSLPWIIVGLGLLLIGILATLIQKYRFAYHKPIVASTSIIVLFSAIGGLAVAKTSFHEKVENRIKAGKFNMAAPLYRKAQEHKPAQLFVGTITEIEEDGFEMETRNDEEYEIIITNKTKKHPDYVPQVDDRISVFGKSSDEKIEAIGIKLQRKFKRPQSSLLKLRQEAHADEPPRRRERLQRERE